MPTTTTSRIANVSLFCEAHVAMDKIIEQLLAMADEGATADAVSQLLAVSVRSTAPDSGAAGRFAWLDDARFSPDGHTATPRS